MLDRGVPISLVQVPLGHADTTQWRRRGNHPGACQVLRRTGSQKREHLRRVVEMMDHKIRVFEIEFGRDRDLLEVVLVLEPIDDIQDQPWSAPNAAKLDDEVDDPRLSAPIAGIMSIDDIDSRVALMF
jgi:hypothetical protein